MCVCNYASIYIYRSSQDSSSLKFFFRPNIFLTQHFFGPKFLRTHNFFGTKNFLDSHFFGLISMGPKFCRTQFFWLTIVWSRNFLDPQFFWDPNFDPNFLDPKSFFGLYDFNKVELLTYWILLLGSPVRSKCKTITWEPSVAMALLSPTCFQILSEMERTFFWCKFFHKIGAFLNFYIFFLFLHNCIYTYLYTCMLIWLHTSMVACSPSCIIAYLHTWKLTYF